MYTLKMNGGYVFQVNILKTIYRNNGRLALQAIDAEDGSPVAILTVNLVNLPCPKDYAWIKDYSENEGFLKQLVEQKVVSEPVQIQPTGYVQVYLCKVLI